MTIDNDFLHKEYGLEANPFTVHFGITRPEYFIGRQQQRKAWASVIDGRKGKEGSSINFIIGDYGYGKTFTLYMILEQYDKDLEILGVYMKLLREDPTPKFGVDFIQRIFSAVSTGKINTNKARKALTNVPKAWEQQASVLSKWLQGDTLAGLLLSGKEKLKKTDLATLGLRQNINSTDAAKEYLAVFLYVLRESGKPTMLLCIDEVEYLFSQMRGAKLANVINALRDICDLPTSPEVVKAGLDISNIIFFFGISQAGWANLNNLEKREQTQGGPFQALMDRQERAIQLTALSLDETAELIKRRLSYNRVTKRFEKEPLIPYTDDFVKYVYELALGNPRKIVERCDYALQDGIEQHAPRLTPAFAKKVFESHSLSTEPIQTTSGSISQHKGRRKRTAK